MERSKTCFKCGETKLLRHFYRHPQMGDGHLGKCKECTKADQRIRERDNPLSVFHSRVSAWTKNPTRKTTYHLVEAAKAAGVLKVPDACQMCGNTESHTADSRAWHAHHFDHSSPLAVVFLCIPCHFELHRLVRSRKPKEQLNTVEECITSLSCTQLGVVMGRSHSRAWKIKRGLNPPLREVERTNIVAWLATNN